MHWPDLDCVRNSEMKFVKVDQNGKFGIIYYQFIFRKIRTNVAIWVEYDGIAGSKVPRSG